MRPSTPPSRPVSSSSGRPAHRRLKLTLLAPLVPLCLVAAVWYFGDLSLLRSPERVAEAVGSVRDSPLGLVYVLVGFAVGTMIFVPITGLMIGTLLAFGPLYGFGYALLGGLAAATSTYWMGRLSGSRALELASGPRLSKLCEALRHRAFRASIVARLLPVGNFTVINVLAGSMRVPFRAYFFGNLIGMIPGLLVLTLFADQIQAAVRNPSRENLVWLAAGVAVLLAMGLFLRRYVRRGKSQRAVVEATEGAHP